MDLNYVIVHCPRGHELQAAREHLTATLSCPVCGIEFVPQAGTAQPTGMAPVPATPPSISPIEYAGTANREPADYPGVTTPMLWSFLIAAVFLSIGTILNLVYRDVLIESQKGNIERPGGLIMLGASSCFGLLGWLVGIVMFLIWIHRIHKDARNAGGYSQVSPGLAVGLSLIPWFNYIWAGITMKKLAKFTRGLAPESRNGDSAIAATSLCLLAGILLAIANLGIFLFNMSIQMTSIQAAMKSGGKPDPTIAAKALATGPLTAGIAAAILGLVCAVIFYVAVKRLEAALYPALGAAPKR